jgi:hypothetical protein
MKATVWMPAFCMCCATALSTSGIGCGMVISQAPRSPGIAPLPV